MVFKENEPGIWKPEKDGDSITGVLIKAEDDVGAMKSKLYTLEVKGETEPEILSVWGSAILDKRMLGINIGTLIRITFKGLGEPSPGKKAPKIFKVEYDDGQSDTEEVVEETTDPVADFPA